MVSRGGAVGVDAWAEEIDRSISAGSICVTADNVERKGLFSDRKLVISASSELGIDGNVEVNAFDLARGIESPLPQKPLDPNVKSTQSCDRNNSKNDFAYIGRRAYQKILSTPSPSEIW